MDASDIGYHRKASGEYQCSRCHGMEWSKKKIRLHVQKHSRPFRCKQDSCVESFATKAHLQRHETTHGRTKTIICALCLAERAWDGPWCCRRIDHLQRHLLRKHKISPTPMQNTAAQYLITLERQRNHLLRTEGLNWTRLDEYFRESGNELIPIILALKQRIDEGSTGIPIIEGHGISPRRSRHIQLVFLGTTDEGTLDQLRSRTQCVLQPQDEGSLAATAGQLLNTASGIAKHPQSAGGSFSTE